MARTVLAVGLVLTASTPLVWTVTRPPANEGTFPSATLNGTAAPGSRQSSPAGAESGTAVRSPSEPPQPRTGNRSPAAPAGAPARPGARSARIADLESPAVHAPRLLRIPDLGVEAPITAVGVDDRGAMALPIDIREVGWYRHGPAPGRSGAAVLAAHVDSRAQGRGVLYDLRKLAIGAQIVVKDSADEEQRFEVVTRRTYDKARLPAAELFARTGPPRLVLITCGGEFDAATRTYASNVVVSALPSPAPRRA